MPNNRRLTKKTIKGKEGVHPGSRKASQLGRVNLRHAKLQQQAKKRTFVKVQKLERPLFFLHSLSSSNPISLSSLRALITDVYLTRHDVRLKELESERRPGRPREKEAIELEEQREREHAEWQTGLEVPDLTHQQTAKLLYTLQTSDKPLVQSHLDLIRFIRLFKDDEKAVVVEKEGRWQKMGLDGDAGLGEDWSGGNGDLAGGEVAMED